MQNNIPPRVEDMERNQLLAEMQLCASQADNAISQLRAWGARYSSAAHEWRMRQLFDRRVSPDSLGEQLARKHALLSSGADLDAPEVNTLSANIAAMRAKLENEQKFPELSDAERIAKSFFSLQSFSISTPLNAIRPDLFVVELGEDYWRLFQGIAFGPFATRGDAENPELLVAHKQAMNLREFATLLATHPNIGIESVSTFIALLEPREQVMILNEWLVARDPIVVVPSPAFWVDAQGNVDAAPEVLALDAVLRIRRRLRVAIRQNQRPELADKLADELARCAIVGELVLARLALAQSYVAALSSQKDAPPSPSAPPDAPEQKSDASTTLHEPIASSGELVDHDDIMITDE